MDDHSRSMTVVVAPAQRLLAALGAGVAIAALVTAAIGLVQYFGVFAQFGPWINRTGAGQVFGNLRQRNEFAPCPVWAWQSRGGLGVRPVPIARRAAFAGFGRNIDHVGLALGIKIGQSGHVNALESGMGAET